MQWFGPPLPVSEDSTCPWVAHPASGLQQATVAHISYSLSLRLVPEGLTLPHTVTRRLIMQKACGHPEGLPQFVSTQFQVLFHSPNRGTFHLSLAVLVHYRSLVSI